MRSRNSFGCLAAAIGLIVVLGFVACIGASSLMARAEEAFGPPARSGFQSWRIGLELGLRAEELLTPADPNASPVTFEIGPDEPTRQIVARLWSSDLIREGNLFTNYLIYTGQDTKLQAGSFQLSAAMSSVELAQALLDPTPESVTLVILSGWRLEEIAAALPSAGVPVAPEDFLLAAWSPPAIEDVPAGASLEGHIFAGSYEIARAADALGLLSVLVSNSAAQITPDLRAALEARGLSLHEALILASIVERESVLAEEMPLIASVFLKRLEADMRLEADPTVQYALGYDQASASWWKTPLSSADLQINSAYNTYLNPGLPPGPIAAPSLEALFAVAFPEASPYYFFQAACDGSGRHVFAETFEEHLANNCP